MSIKKTTNFLIGQGFNMFMMMHITRYSKEEKISIPEIIKIFKDNSIDPNYVAYMSFNGYESFKRLISGLKEE